MDDEKGINLILNNLQECFKPKYKHLITLYRLNPNEQSNDVDVAILNGLLKAYNTKLPAQTSGNEYNRELAKVRENKRIQLKLCMAWNRFDIAKNFIINEDFKEIVSYTQPHIDLF